MSYRKIGDLIQLVDVRNKDLSITHLVGLTINKKFIPSVANTIGTDMSNYKIIRKNQFACSTMQVRRDKKMPVALLKQLDVAIISQAYPVFEVIDEKELIPEYLMLWFSRSEFDREACFHAVGGVRGSLEWEDFCNMELPVPSIEKQREIVAQYQAVENKIKVNEQICEKLEAAAQTLYKQWFVDFEFPCLPSGYRPHGQVNQNLPIDEYITKIGSVCTYSKVGGLPVSDGKTWFVYLILCENDSVYKGITNDLYRRFYEHYMGEGAEWTKLNKPLKVIHWESFATKEEAAKREKDLKTGYGRTWISRQIEKAGGITQLKTSLPAPQTELRTAGKMVFNQELEKDIPEGWEVIKVKDFCDEMKNGATPSRDNLDYWDSNDIPWLKTGEISNNVVFDTEEYISKEGFKNSSTKLIPKDSVLMAMYGATAGQLAYLKKEVTTNQACCAMISKDKNKMSFLYYALLNQQNHIVTLANGGAQANLSKQIIEELDLILPQDMDKIPLEKFSYLIEEKAIKTQENQKLTQLQSLLLSRLATLEG